MQLIDELRAEHDVIEQVAGALLTYAASPSPARARSDGAAFLRFFRLYANHFHHAREEDTLFVALRDRAGLSVDHGPVATMIADHARMAGLLDAVADSLDAGPDADGRLTRIGHRLRACAVAPHRRRELRPLPGVRAQAAP